MRRNDRAKDLAFSLELIDRCSHGVMALTDEENTPYCLPLSFVRIERNLYFHCAHQGRKISILRARPKVCVTFVGKDRPAYLEPAEYTTFYQSVIVNGHAEEVTEAEEKICALRALCQKLTPHAMDGDKFDLAIAKSLSVTGVWKVSMDEISGKEKQEKQR